LAPAGGFGKKRFYLMRVGVLGGFSGWPWELALFSALEAGALIGKVLPICLGFRLAGGRTFFCFAKRK
jgi:hypothetical protein